MCSYVNLGLGWGGGAVCVLYWHVSHFVWQVWAIDKLLWSEALWSESLWSELSLPADRPLFKHVLFPPLSLVTRPVSQTHACTHTHTGTIAFVACERSQYVSIELSVVPTGCAPFCLSGLHGIIYCIMTVWDKLLHPPAAQQTGNINMHQWTNRCCTLPPNTCVNSSSNQIKSNFICIALFWHKMYIKSKLRAN